VVALEIPSQIPDHSAGKGEAKRPEPALSGECPEPGTSPETGASGAREGNHQQLFSITAATALAATSASLLAALAAAAVLLAGVPAGHGTRLGAGAALAEMARAGSGRNRDPRPEMIWTY
jgi:hypothetical protein